jgi:hypothetical protein
MNASAPPRSSIIALIAFTLCGPLLWALHLAISYLTHHVMCSTNAATVAYAQWVAVAAGIVIAALLGGAARYTAALAAVCGCGALAHDTRRFLQAVARSLALLALVGVTWGTIAAVLLPPCAALR